jgi:hypothetical protein
MLQKREDNGRRGKDKKEGKRREDKRGEAIKVRKEKPSCQSLRWS